jgi:hypothetical protein
VRVAFGYLGSLTFVMFRFIRPPNFFFINKDGKYFALFQKIIKRFGQMSGHLSVLIAYVVGVV